MPLSVPLSSARSGIRLTIDIALALLLAILTFLMHALTATLSYLSPTRFVSRMPCLQPYHTLLHPTTATSTPSALQASPAPPIAISRRCLTVNSRSILAEELSIPATAPHDPTTAPLPHPPVHLFLVTGNPGTVHFYVRFFSQLHRLSNGALHIHSLSFAGHESLATAHPSTSHRQPLYNLNDQTELWLAYLRDWLQQQTEPVQVVLCGHSIGAWMVLELVERLGSDRVLHSFLLFPTLSQMSRTPAGRRLQFVFAYCRPLLVLLARLLHPIVPTILLRLLVRFLVRHPRRSINRSVELDDTANTVVDLFSPHVLSQCLYLAHSELQIVVDERPAHTRLMAEGRATLVSGAADEWDPVWLQEDRRRRIAELREVRMEKDVRHAFVSGNSERVAEVVWMELQNLISTTSTDKLAHARYERITQHLQPSAHIFV